MCIKQQLTAVLIRKTPVNYSYDFQGLHGFTEHLQT